jgi:hypothetical protein
MFSTVFLCVKEKNKYKFTCKEFADFLEADKYFTDNYKDINCISTMTPLPYSAKVKTPLKGVVFKLWTLWNPR